MRGEERRGEVMKRSEETSNKASKEKRKRKRKKEIKEGRRKKR